jgi:hypothetical protein
MRPLTDLHEPMSHLLPGGGMSPPSGPIPELSAEDRARRTAAATSAHVEVATAPSSSFVALLDRASRLDLDDPSWADLTVAAAAVTAALARVHRLPPHLVVEPGESPVVVARGLAVASRQLQRHT